MATAYNRSAWRNYLRVRGEYDELAFRVEHAKELPPRTRRIHPLQQRYIAATGTTSAYAENTARTLIGGAPHMNYLRVRGEYRPPHCPGPEHGELPPRTRRIRSGFGHASERVGTTSAYAENTYHHWWGQLHHRNYLRVRGECPK